MAMLCITCKFNDSVQIDAGSAHISGTYTAITQAMDPRIDHIVSFARLNYWYMSRIPRVLPPWGNITRPFQPDVNHGICNGFL